MEVKNTLQKRFGTKDSVRCSEFRGGRFSEVANVLQVWDFQSVTRTLSALGSVSASRSVRSGRFYRTQRFRMLQYALIVHDETHEELGIYDRLRCSLELCTAF